MRRVKKELSLVDSYRFNKCCYKDVEARINEWMKDYIVANPYSSSCDPVKKRQQWQLTLENKKRNKVPRDVVRAIERVLGNPIYELFGATKEECAEVGILEDHNETPLATLTEEKLKALIAKRQASDNKLNNNKEKEEAPEHKMTECVSEGITNTDASNQSDRMPDAQEQTDTDSITNTNTIPAANTHTARVFRIGTLTEELLLSCASKRWKGARWKEALQKYVEEAVDLKCSDTIIKEAAKITYQLLDDTTLSCLQTSEGKCKAFYMFAKNFAISLDDVYGKGLETDEAVDFVTSLATTARRAVVQKSSDASAKRKFLIEEYLKAYLNEYPRRKKNRFHEIDEDLEHAAEDEDAYVDDGRPTLEQYLLHTALTGEQTGVTFSQMPTGEAKSYTIEEIICKAIKGVERYAELFDKYKRIIVTTIQNKLITPESLSEKHGEYQLSDEEYNQNVVVVRGLLENLKHNFARATELMPVDVLSSHQYKELENAYQNATTDSAVRFSGFNDADTVADAKIQLRVSDANRALFRYAIGNKELMDAAESRAMAKYERENSEKPEKERISWEHLPKKERVKRRRSEEATIICTEKEYEWMTILWPSLLVFRRKVIFTTVSKMQFQYLDIENGVSLPYDTWTEDALVFADEGDASKGYQTMQYVKNQYNEIYDLKLLLTCLHDQLNEALERTDIRNMKGNWSKWKHHYDLHYDDNNKKKRITDLGDGLGTMRSSYRYLKKIMEKYHLKSCFKLKQADTVSNKEMIWYVYAGGLYFIADASGKRGELAAFYNKTTGQVDVYKLIYGKDTSISDEKDKLRMQYGEENEINLVHMTSAMRGFIINFAQVMRELAWAYQDIDYQYKLENNKKGILVQSKMTERSAWHNVLIAFGMDDEHNTRSEYLMNQIPPSKLKRKKGIMSPFYAFGWSATIVIATEDNREDIRFSGFNVPTTPEMILGIEASNGRVFCLSGTMDIDSSIANYNRNELIGMLGEEHVSSLSEDPIWMSHVVDELEAKWLPYRDGRIKTNADYGNWPVVYHPDDTETDKDIATMHMLQAYLVNYPECAHEIGEIINTATSACEQSECDFARGRLITFARHVDRFVKESIPAFLHFEKRLPVDDTKRRGNEWSERTLTNIFNILVEAHKKATGNDTSVALVVLRAATFNDEKTWQDIKDRREQGERQYLITAYNTAGVGVNVESKKPVTVSDDQIVLLPLQNKEDARLQKMDVSSVYLGPITNNLVPVVTNVNNMNDVVARIDETLHLVNGGDIIASEGRRSMITIMDLLQGVSGSRDDYRKDGYLKMAGYRKIAERDVLQAIGRISRGGCKLKNIDIYISTDIGTVLSRNLLDDDESAGGSCSETPKKRHPKILLTPEAEAVYRALQKAQAGVLEDDRKYRILRQNMTHGIEFHSHVQSLIHREYGVASMNPDQMDAYRGLRKEVVKTYSSNDKRCFSNIMFSYFEEPVNSYYYSKKNDYECCIIDAEKITVDAYKNSDVVLEKDYDGTAEISERIFRFDILFAYPGMREHFMENNMFTNCEKGQFVLCPEAANLACGEQGEVASKFILRKELGMICNDITDGVRYERFDVELNSDVYIDFKNYTNGELSPKRMRELIEKTQEKAVKINAKKVYIVNLIADETGTVQAYDDNTEKSVQVVYINGLLDKQGCIIRPHLSQFLKEDIVGQAISTQTVPTISWETSKYVNGTTGEIGSVRNIDLATIDVSMFAKIKGMAYFANNAGYAFFDKNGAYLTGENNTAVATYKFPLDVDIPKTATVMCISHRTGKGFELNVTGQVKYIGELLGEQDAKVSEKIEKIEQKISSPQNMRDIVTKDVLENTDSINISAPNTKSGNIISFYANITNMSTLKIGHGTAAYASSNVRIKNNTVEIHRQDSLDVLVNTYTHNLIFNKFIDVLIETHLNNTADVTISSENGSYHIKNVEWLGSSGNVFATAVSGKYTHCELSYYCKDISKPVWFFGDSYMSQWNVYAYEYGAKNWLNDSYSGRNSSEAQAVASIKKDIAKGIPKVIVWALGMNDQEKYSWGLTQWKNGYEVVKDICKKNNIELILVTIPNTPTMKNTEKNKIIKESGYRYVDIAALVGGESENSTWYEGMLSEDNVHGSEIGRKAIALKMMTDIPEMI